jgi:hypothetical protein
MIAESLTKDEIYNRFDAEWILLEDPEVDANLNVIRGRVLFHSKSRDEVYQKAIELRPANSAFLYTGGIPDGSEIIL